MVSRLLTWIGWESNTAEDSEREDTIRRRSATANLFEKKQPGTKRECEVATAQGEFNPYDTGKFDRSASWERISKTQR